MDQREERDRMERRYGRDDYDDYGSAEYQERSFDPLGRGPVLGERERGVDYTGGRYDDGARYGYRARPQGGRYDGGPGRRRVYGDDYAPYSITEGGALSGQRDYRQDAGRDRREHAYRVAYGDHHPDHKGHHEAGDHRSFWERAGDRMAAWFGEGEAHHRGRGPSGYQRTDERISDEINERLTEDPWLDASGVSIAVSGGEVTLNGTVPEREAKHRAERLIEDLTGVTHVQNNLRVRRGDPLTGSGTGFGDSAHEAQMQAAARTSKN